VIQSFADAETEDIYNGLNSKRARKRLNPIFCEAARRKLDMLEAAIDLVDLNIPPANRLEALKGNLKGKYSIRINEQYRIVFSWGDHGPEQIKITDYH
jgi:toxin HigB-1